MGSTVEDRPTERPRGVGQPSRRPTSRLEYLQAERAQLRAVVREQNPLRVLGDPDASDEAKARAAEMYGRFLDLDKRMTIEIRQLLLDAAGIPKLPPMTKADPKAKQVLVVSIKTPRPREAKRRTTSTTRTTVTASSSDDDPDPAREGNGAEAHLDLIGGTR